MTIIQLAATIALVPAVTFVSWRKGRDGGYIWGVIGWLLIFGLTHWTLEPRAAWPGLGIAAAAATVWVLWRSLLTGRTLTPVATRDVWFTASRHAIAALLLIPFWSSWVFLVPALLVFIWGNTEMAKSRARMRYQAGQDVGQEVEAIQGLAFAVLLAGAVLVRP